MESIKLKLIISYVLIVCLFGTFLFKSLLVVQGSDSEAIHIKISETARVGNPASTIGVEFNSKEDQIGKLSGGSDDFPYATLYYKADLSSITEPIKSGKLKINVKVQSQGNLNVYEVTEDWDRNTISHENRPSTSDAPIATVRDLGYSSGAYAVHELDITQYLKGLQAKEDRSVNLMINFEHYKDERHDTRVCITGSGSSVSYPYIELVTVEQLGTAKTQEEKPVFSELKVLAKMNILRQNDKLPGDLNQNISRAEFVHYALRLYNLGDEDFAGVETVFEDVKKESPYYSSIAVAEQIGLIHGSSNINFRPEDPITYNEAIKIIVCILGYEPKAIAQGGYPAGYISVAASNGLLKGFSTSSNNNFITFDAAFKLFYHSLDIPIFKATGYSTSPTYSTDKNITLLSEKFKTYKVEGIVTGNKNTTLAYGGKASKDAILIDNIAYKINDDSAHELLGCYVECYYTEENSRKVREIIYIDIVHNRNEYITVEANDIKDVKNMILTYYRDDREEIIEITSDAKIIYNGKAIDKETELTDELFEIILGNIKFLNNGSGSSYDVIFITDYQSMVVQSVNTTTGVIYDKYNPGKNISLRLNSSDFSYSITDKEGNMLDYTQLGEWDVLWVAKSKDENLIEIKASRDFVTGEASSYFKEDEIIKQVTIDNIVYDVLNDADMSDVESAKGRKGTFYLDLQGNIAAVSYQKSVAGSKFGYVLAIGKDEGLNANVQIQMLVAGEEEPVIFLCNDKLEIDGEIKKNEEVLTYFKDTFGEIKRQGIYFKTNESNLITMIDTAYKSEYENEDSLVLRYERRPNSDDKLRHKNDMFLGCYPFSMGRTLIVNVPSDPNNIDDYDIVTSALGHDADIPVAALYSMGSLKPEMDIVVLNIATGVSASVDERAELSIVEKLSTAIDENGEVYKKLTVFNHAGITTREVKVLEDKYNDVAGLSVGDIIRYSANNRNELIAIQRYYNYAENKVLIPTPTYYFGQSRVNIGKVYMKEDGYIRVARDVENIEDQSLDTLFIQNKNLIIYEVVNNKLIVESAKYEDIMDYIHCGDDATDVAIHTRYGDYKSMFFIKGRPQGEQSGGDDPGEPISQDGPYKITTAARVGVKDGVGTVAINQVEDQIGRRSGFDETYAKLYYKADLSKITNPVSKAVLKFNAKAFTAITLSIYAVEEDWDETISVENQPQLGSLIAQENLLAYVDGGYNYLVREIDITAYVQELQANNNMHVNIMLDPVHYNTSHPADNRILITGVTGGSYPYIEIETEEINPD